MNRRPGIPLLARRSNIVLIGLFMIFLWLPSLDIIFHLDWTKPRDENRVLADLPKIPSGWRGWQPYLAGLEAFFDDHFGFRKCLVLWNNKLRWALFKEKNLPSVLVGKDGWLFTTGDQMIDHYSGRLQFTQEELRSWQVLLERRRNWLERRGISFVFVVAPDKQTVYPEELPDWLVKVRPQTKLDQFYTYMRAHSTVPILDLRDAVRDARIINPTYLQTDTHWNNYGGFVAYQKLMRTLCLQTQGLDPLPLSSFILTNQMPPSVKIWWRTNLYWLTPFDSTNQLEPGHDLATLLGVNMSESNICFLLPKPGLPQFTTLFSRLGRIEQPWFTTNPHASGRALVFRDSFSTCWVQFLGYHFNRVTYVWQSEMDPAWIIRENPNIVVCEMVERLFNVADPKKLALQEALN